MRRLLWAVAVAASSGVGAAAAASSGGSAAFGAAPAKRWLVGVQLRVVPRDYASASSFEKRVEGAVGAALSDPRLSTGDAKVVVLPEWSGTFLALDGEDPAVYSAPTLAQALQTLVETDAPFRERLISRGIFRPGQPLDRDAVLGELFRFKAASMRAAYADAGFRLSRRFHAVVVLGSIVLPEGGEGTPLMNTSFVFGPEGATLDVVRKAHMADEEKGFTAPADVASNRPVATGAGTVGVMICADGWFSDVYARLKGAELLAQPGFDREGLPSFDRDAWRRYSLVGRIRESGALYGVNPFLSGRLWEMRPGGYGVGVDLTKPAGAQTLEVATDTDRDTFIVIEAGASPGDRS